MNAMKRFLLVLLMWPAWANGQIITTWLGGGLGGGTDGVGDGLNKSFAKFINPANAFFDQHGNFYFADQVEQRVRKVDTAGIVTSVAGTGGLGGFNGDSGLADTSELFQPESVITDSIGNVYIADSRNHRIRKISYITGIISTIAGTGIAGYNGDNILAINAQLSGPSDICFDTKGNLYISDGGNHRIRKINSSGVITTYAGSGILGCTVNGGHADTTEIGASTGICSDTIGNIYISDESEERVYKVDTSGVITIVVGGTGSGVYNGDNIPAITAEIDPFKLSINHAGNLFVADGINNRVRMIDDSGIIHTAAGNGLSAYSGDNGFADSASIEEPGAVGFDACDNLYIAETSPAPARFRKVTFYTCMPDTATFINKITSNQSINIYPNPVNDVLHIDYASTNTQFTISNMLGLSVLQGLLSAGTNSINVSALPPGLYVLGLSPFPSERVGVRLFRKIVKE